MFVGIKVVNKSNTNYKENENEVSSIPYWLAIATDSNNYIVKIKNNNVNDKQDTFIELNFNNVEQVKIVFKHFLNKYNNQNIYFKATITYLNSLFVLNDSSLVGDPCITNTLKNFENRILNNLDEINILLK